MNNKILIGCSYTFSTRKCYFINADNSIEDNNGYIVNYEELNKFAILNNSPWFLEAENYCIKAADNDEFQWVCEYDVLTYDHTSTSVFGYGKTEEEALAKCKNNIKFLQEKYNKENKTVQIKDGFLSY